MNASKPDLTVSNLSVGLITAIGNGSFSFPVTFQVNNAGTAMAVASWYDRGYLSATGTLHDADQVLGGSTQHTTNLAASASYTVTTTFTTSTTTAPGNWTLIVKADGGANASGQYSPTGPNYVDEFNEFNNTQAMTINLPANPKPDLVLGNTSVGAISINQAGAYSFPVTFTVTNHGSFAAAATWYDMAYLSTDAALDNADLNLSGTRAHTSSLASGASYIATVTFTTAAATAPGVYTLFVKTDGRGTTIGTGTNTDSGYVAEGDETNNTQALSITLPAKPDFTVSNASIGTITVNQNGSYRIPVSWTVTNNGGATAQPTWYDQGYLSADATLDNADPAMGYVAHGMALAAGASYNASTTFTTATTTAPGIYTLFVKADGHGGSVSGTNTDKGSVAEGDETNNTQALSITLPARPDFTVSNASIGTITVNQNGSYRIPVSWAVTNNGGATAQPTWYDEGYLSADAILDDADPAMGYVAHSAALAAGASYNASTTFTTATTTAPGTYTLFVKADGHGGSVSGTNTDKGSVAEGDETNNTQALSITLPGKPDLVPSNVSVGTIVKNANGSYSIPVSFQVNNIGGSTAVATWYDMAYLSTDAALDNGDLSLSGSRARTTSLAPGASYTVTATFATPTTTVAGAYTLFVKADGRGMTIGSGTNTDNGFVAEAAETNNATSIAVILP